MAPKPNPYVTGIPPGNVSGAKLSVAFKEMTGSLPAFSSVMRTSGPPGLYGGIGPTTETTSTGPRLEAEDDSAHGAALAEDPPEGDVTAPSAIPAATATITVTMTARTATLLVTALLFRGFVLHQSRSKMPFRD